MKFLVNLGLFCAFIASHEIASAKTYVYTCTTALIDRRGFEAPRTRHEAYYRAQDGDRVGILAHQFCPDALNKCLNNFARGGGCCQVVGASALGGDYTQHVLHAMGPYSRACQGGRINPPPPGGGRPPRTGQPGVQLFNDHGLCREANFIAAVGPNTNCLNLQNSWPVRSVMIRGACQRVAEMDAVEACERYKYR